jgi:nickel/cobalt exporter
MDAHAAAHAREIREKFVGKSVSTTDIVWFGFTGGLLPCPAAVAVLLICLQLRQFSLGIGMVAAFSVGLAITLVSVGLLAAWGQSAVRSRFQGMDGWLVRLPYISAALVFTIGLVITARGLWALTLA